MTPAVALGLIGPWVIAPTSSLLANENRALAFVQAPRSALQPATADIGNTILAGRYVLEMRLVLAELKDVGGTMRVLTDDFVCATDPVFSFDGTRIAFSGKRAREDHLQIWELAVTERLAVDDPVAQRLVVCNADCVNPVYMPDGRLVFSSLLSREYEEHGGRYSFSLFSARPGGETPDRLTFNPSSDFDPAVLHDGRLLYSSWQHVGNHHWPRGVVALLHVNSDGTGVFPLTGNHRGPWLKRGSLPLEGGIVAFLESDRFADFGAGALVTTSLNDAFAPYETLISADDYRVSDLAKLPANGLVSGGGIVFSARPVQSGSAVNDARATFGLYIYENGIVRLLYDDPDYHELAPAVGGSVARPELRVSTVVPDTAYGYLAILNCNETDRTSRGKRTGPLRPGSVKAVRVLEGMALRWRGTGLREGASGPAFFNANGLVGVPGREDEPMIRPNSATGYIPTRILGEVPPAADGSVYLKVPSDRPLRIQLIDRDGFTIVDERAWFWVRPNERRVCIGCHENRELAPNNAVPQAVRRMPTDLTDPAGWQTVSFRKDIQPILRTNCALADCHVPPTPTAGMNLTAFQLNGERDAVLADRFGPAYANLLMRRENKPFGIGGRRIHPGDARSSPMLWMLYGRALAPQYQPAPFERPMISPHPGPMLPEADLALIRKWIDLGAQYDDESPAGPWPYKIHSVDKLVMEGAPRAK